MLDLHYLLVCLSVSGVWQVSYGEASVHITVAARNTSDGAEMMPPSDDGGHCGMPGNYCTSIGNALKTVVWLKTDPEAVENYTKGRLKFDSPFFNITISLNSLATVANCCIFIESSPGDGTPFLDISDLPNLALTIEGNSTECRHTKVCTMPRHMELHVDFNATLPVFLRVLNSSLVTFSQLEFEGTARNCFSKGFTKPLVLIEESFRIYFNDVVFIQYPSCNKVCKIVNSLQTVFYRVTVDGSLYNNVQMPQFDRDEASIAVQVDFSGGSMDKAESLSQRCQQESALGNQCLGASTTGIVFQQIDGMAADVHPSIAFIDCNFTGVGAPIPIFDQKLKMAKGITFKGIALSVNFSGSCHRSLLLDRCMIEGSETPYGSALSVTFEGNTHSSAVGNLANIMNSQFHQNIGQWAGAVIGRFLGSRLVDNKIAIKSCNFSGNLGKDEGGAIAFHTTPKATSRKNTILFDDCIFTNNSAGGHRIGISFPGAALLLRTRTPEVFRKYKAPEYALRKGGPYAVTISNCNVAWNLGSGAIHAIRTNIFFEGKNLLEHNNYSAVFLMSSHVNITGNFTMRNNRGSHGAGFYLTLFSSVFARLALAFDITNNTATELGSGIFADRTSSSSSLEDLLFSSSFAWNSTNKKEITCPIQFPSRASMETLFHTNRAHGSVPAVFLASLHRCFRDFEPLLNDLYYNDAGKIATRCYCMPYAPGEWDFREDKLYTAPEGYTEEVKEVRQKYFEDPGYQELCPKSQLDHSSDVTGDITASPGEVCWRNTTRPLNIMNSVNLTAFRLEVCNTTNPGFYQPPHCYSRIQQHYVVNTAYLGAERSLSQKALGTRASWIFFGEATTSCFKPVGSDVWYFKRGCFAERIISEVKKSRTDLTLATDCVLHRLNFLMRRLRVGMTNIAPGYRFVLLPWASIIQTWDRWQPITDSVCQQDTNGTYFVQNQSISEITLHPAPGEHFNLYFRTTDELLHVRPIPLSLTVQSHGDDVLLGKGQKYVYVPGESLIFSSKSSVRDIVLYGPVNATGVLEVTAKAGSQYYEAGEARLSLRIPFQLRTCHLGYTPSNASAEEVRNIVRNLSYRTKSYSSTPREMTKSASKAVKRISRRVAGYSRTPQDRTYNTYDYYLRTHQQLFFTFRSSEFERVFEAMACQCPNHSCVLECVMGVTMLIKRRCWAGSWKDPYPFHGNNQTDFAKNVPLRMWQNVPWRWYRSYGGPIEALDSKFAVGGCDRIECALRPSTRYHNRSDWILGVDEDCDEDCNCQGPLCSICKPNMTRLPASVGCEDCRNRLQFPLWSIFAMMAVTCMILIAVLFFFNFGVTPTIDSWLLFSQIYFDSFGHWTRNASLVARSTLTLGFGLLCLDNSPSPMTVGLINTFVPVFLVTITAILWRLGCRGHGSALWVRLSKRNSVVHVFWFIFLYCSSTIAYLAVRLLRCVPLGDPPGSQVLFYDGTVKCFHAAHAPYAVAAILLILIFVLPPPILLVWHPFHIYPTLKAIVDEASRPYETSRRWWAAVNIMRRVLLSLVHGLVANGRFRHTTNAMIICSFVAAQGIFRPFKRNASLGRIKDVDNLFEMACLLILAYMSILHLVFSDVPDAYMDGKKHRLVAVPVVYSLVSAVAAIMYFYRYAASWRSTLLRSPRNTATGVCIEDSCEDYGTQHDDALTMREICSNPIEIARPPSFSTAEPSSSRSSCGSCGRSKSCSSVNVDPRASKSGLRDPLLAELLQDD